MAVTKLYTMSYIDIDTASGASVDLFQLLNWSPDPGIANLILGGAGEVNNTFVTTTGQAPSLSFVTSQLDTALDGIALTGLIIDSDADDEGFVAFLKKYAEGGTRASGANQMSLTVNEGLLVPRQLTASLGGVATISYDLFVTYDGTNLPVVVSVTDTITPTPVADQAFTLGPIVSNGTNLEGVQSVTVDFGLSVVVQRSPSDLYPTFVAIDKQQPTISFVTTMADYLNTLSMLGAAVSASDFIVYLAKQTEGANRAAYNASTHISITVDEGVIQPAASTFGPGPALMNWNCVPTYDGTNAVLVISTVADLP